MFKIIMITAVIILAMGWIAYGIWRYKTYVDEKNNPEETTEHLKKVKSGFAEYTKKLANFKKKPYERK